MPILAFVMTRLALARLHLLRSIASITTTFRLFEQPRFPGAGTRKKAETARPVDGRRDVRKLWRGTLQQHG
jgi:hypothetical protein